ncbi:glycosyltransferase family 2 protein [Kineococcus endophyticus]|uniref:Glycosyltransferase family 2 protein n=1 Tax=Kineococcus endophyticus TaxID=1181883 RepID=A0ABV3P1M9_9ACTN
MTTPGGLGIVVVNYGDPAVLERHLLRHDLRSLGRIVVVDNFSSAAYRDAVDALCRRRGLDAVLRPANDGFGAGVNAGAAHALAAGCDALLVVNPDLRLDPAVAAALHAEVRAHPSRLVAPRIVREDGRLWFDGAEVSLRTGRTARTGRLTGPDLVPWLTGACLAVHRDLWETVGGFAPEYFLYWEDVDLSLRVQRAGGEVAVRRDLLAVHAVGGTQAGRHKSPVYVEFHCRNRLLFARRHLGVRAALRQALDAPRYAAEVLRRDGWRRLLTDRAPVRAAVRGTLAGWAVALSPRRRSGSAAVRPTGRPTSSPPSSTAVPTT